MTIRFVPKNTYRDELEMRGFEINDEVWKKYKDRQRKYEEDQEKKNETKVDEDNQMTIKW